MRIARLVSILVILTSIAAPAYLSPISVESKQSGCTVYSASWNRVALNGDYRGWWIENQSSNAILTIEFWSGVNATGSIIGSVNVPSLSSFIPSYFTPVPASIGYYFDLVGPNDLRLCSVGPATPTPTSTATPTSTSTPTVTLTYTPTITPTMVIVTVTHSPTPTQDIVYLTEQIALQQSNMSIIFSFAIVTLLGLVIIGLFMRVRW